jgi:hypothetical protein
MLDSTTLFGPIEFPLTERITTHGELLSMGEKNRTIIEKSFSRREY